MDWLEKEREKKWVIEREGILSRIVRDFGRLGILDNQIVFVRLVRIQKWVEEASCIRAMAPVHCFSAFCRALMRDTGLAGVEVLLGSKTRGDAGWQACIITLGRVWLLHVFCSLLVSASRSQRLFGFSGRTGVLQSVDELIVEEETMLLRPFGS